MHTTLKRTAAAVGAAAAAAGAALAIAPTASADVAYTNVSDTFIPYDAPGAFNPGNQNVIISPAYGTITPIFCQIDNGAWRNCYQEGWNHEPHQVHYLANVNGHGTWATVDLPQGSSVPQLPVIQLPPGSISGSIANIGGSTGSTGSGGAHGGLNIDLGGSLGNIGIGLQGGTGSA